MATHHILLFVIFTINTAYCLELRVFTVATEATEGFQRFNRSLSVYGFKSEVLGHGIQWQGGNVIDSAGGGHKIS